MSKPDVVFYCQDGHEDRRLVQRMKWMAQQGLWVGVIKRSATQYLTKDGEEFRSQRLKEGGVPSPVVRVRVPLRCTCGLTVPVNDGRLQFFCDREAPTIGNEASLVSLRDWLDKTPPWQAYPDAF